MTQQVDQETGEILETLADFDDERMIKMLARYDEQLETAARRKWTAEQELQRRAAERGATVIHGKGMDYKIETKKEYDRTQLHQMVEFLTPVQLDKCFTPGHYEQVWMETKHDMQQWNKAGRENGGELQEGLDALTFPGKASGKLVQT